MADTSLQILIELKDRATQELQGVTNKIKNNAAQIQAVGASMLAVGAATGLAAKGFIEAAADFEQTTIAFTTMLGSADKANELLKDLAKFASKTPFELKDVEKGAKQLMAYGVETKQLIPTLKSLGDVASAVGMDKFPNLVLAFGQVKAAGRLTGMELRQFSETGVPLLGTLATQMGVTTAEMGKMISEGKVGFDQVDIALKSLTDTGGRFDNMMAKQSTTFSGMVSNLKDQINLFMREGGAPLLDFGKQVVALLINIVTGLNQWAKAHPQLAEAIGIILVAMTALLIPLGTLLVMLPGLVVLIEAVGAAMALLTIPIALVIVAIGAFIATGVIMVTRWSEFKTGLQVIWEGILTVWNFTVDSIKAAWGASMDWLGEKVDQVFSGIKNTITSSINYIIDKINKFIGRANSLSSSFKGIGISIPNIPEIPRLAKGGIVTSPTLAMIGEAGPEAVIPLNKKNGMGGLTVNFYLDKSVITIDDFKDQVGDYLTKKIMLNSAIAG